LFKNAISQLNTSVSLTAVAT